MAFLKGHRKHNTMADESEHFDGGKQPEANGSSPRPQSGERNGDSPVKRSHSVEPAVYSKHDLLFDATLCEIKPTQSQEPMHKLLLTVNFMRSLHEFRRICGAELLVKLTKDEGPESPLPEICSIAPKSSFVQVSDREIMTRTAVSAGASGEGGPAGLKIGVDGSGYVGKMAEPVKIG
jgi:hypothetical protein